MCFYPFQTASPPLSRRLTAIHGRVVRNAGYERRSLLVTSNLAFSEWGQIFQGERMTAALLDRLTHRCAIFEMNGESFRFRESMKSKRGKKAE